MNTGMRARVQIRLLFLGGDDPESLQQANGPDKPPTSHIIELQARQEILSGNKLESDWGRHPQYQPVPPHTVHTGPRGM